MSKALRYYGEIAAHGGHTIRVEIHKEGFTGTEEELTFPAESPVVIDWAEKDKIEPVLASSCTLRIESMADRQFLNELYTVEAGSVLLKVFRDDNLYWSGTLDPEQYEEPYSFMKNYDVDVTFNDFAYLDRQKYTGTTNQSVKDLIEYCVSHCGAIYGAIIWNTSTLSADGTDTAYTQSFVKASNWYDEEGEASTLREVLEETLRAFSLRVKQKNGNIYIYDLNAIYSQEPVSVVWDGTDAMIKADKVYNNIEVTWSPYNTNRFIASKIKCIGEDTSILFPQNDALGNAEWLNGEAMGNSYASTVGMQNEWWNTRFTQSLSVYPYILKNREGFMLKLSQDGEGATLGTGTKFFKIEPQYSGAADEGVMVYLGRFDYYREMRLTGSVHYRNMIGHGSTYPMFGNLSNSDAVIFDRFYIPKINNASNYYLRLKVEALIDTRLNPYESKITDGYQDINENYIDHVFIPYELRIDGDDGNPYFWNNSNIIESDSDNASLYASQFMWTSSRGSVFGSGYSSALHFSSSAFEPEASTSEIGWTINTIAMPKHTKIVSDSVKAIGMGEFIMPPTVGGWCTLSISRMIKSFSVNGKHDNELDGALGWFAIKGVTLELIDKYGNLIETEDVVYSSNINSNAKEGINVDILIDSSDTMVNSAKGLLVTSNNTPIRSYQRNGDQGSLGQLMCNTIYSQYGDRNLVITGTAELIPSASILSEENTEGKFILQSESQDLRSNTSNISMVQFSQDNYAPRS